MYGEIYASQFPASRLDAQLLIAADSPCMVALSACSINSLPPTASTPPLSGHSFSCVMHCVIAPAVHRRDMSSAADEQHDNSR